MRVRHRVALFAHRTIDVDVAHTLLRAAVTIAAVAVRWVRAGLTEFLGAQGCAAIAVGRIAVVTTFTGFDNAVAAPSRDATIRIGVRVAHFAHPAVRIIITYAFARRDVATAALACGAVCVRLPELLCAPRCAAVAIGRVVVVATFRRFNDAVTTTTRNALVRIKARVADVVHRAVDVFVALARAARGITSVACTSTRKCTRLTDFQEALAIATIAGRRIAVIAPFVDFDDAIATSRIHTEIGVVAHVAELSHRTIRNFIADTGILRNIAKLARSLFTEPQSYRAGVAG